MFQCTFTGNLGKDPTFQYDTDGTPLAMMSVAVSRGKEQPACWISVTLRGKPAEMFAERNPGKGTRVVVAVDYAPKVDMYTNSKGEKEACLKMRAAFVEVAQERE